MGGVRAHRQHLRPGAPPPPSAAAVGVGWGSPPPVARGSRRSDTLVEDVEDVEELEDEAVGEAQLLAYEAEKAIEDKLVSFGPGFTVLKREVAKEERLHQRV